MNFFDDIERFGDSPAVISDQGDALSYRSLATLANGISRHLSYRAVVILGCENGIPSLAAYLACLRTRAVPLLVDAGTSPEVLRNLLEAYRPEFVWLQVSQAAAIDGQEIMRLEEYVLISTSPVTRTPLHPDLALLLTTSGSTGSPMLVRLSYGNIESNAVAIAEYLGITQADRPITSLPMNYTFGLSIINSHLQCGCTIIVSKNSVLDKGFWSAVRTHGATTFSGVPYTFEMLRKLGLDRLPLSTIQTLTQAGGKLGPERAREIATFCESRGIAFVVMYGQAEATARMSYLPPEFAVTKAGSIGIAIPGGMLWIEDDSGVVVSEPELEGELVYRGPNVSLGYAATRADLAKGDENMGTLRTGDLARRDADGFFYISGRKKRFLKLFGNRVNLDDVERILEHAGYPCACTGTDDLLRIFLVSTSQTSGHEGSVRALAASRLGVHPSAVKVQTVERLPRNAAGKILYAALPK